MDPITFLGFDPETFRKWVLFMTSISVTLTIGVGLGHWIGFVRAKTKFLGDNRRKIDRDSVIVQMIRIRELNKDEREFSVVSMGGILPLHTVFGNKRLEEAIMRSIPPSSNNKNILPNLENDLYKLAMRRATEYVTGNDPVASMAALYHRHTEYRSHRVALMLVVSSGDDDSLMTRILIANPQDLKKVLALGRKTLDASRLSRPEHGKYIGLYWSMASELEKSEATRKEGNGDMERVWTADIEVHVQLSGG